MRNIIVRNTSQTPIYQQLYDQISSQIIKGELKADEPLPSMRVFAKEIRVSIITIKKTWEILERNGFIYTIKGKGSYVKENTKKMLDDKRRETIKDFLKETVVLSKEYQLSQNELIDIIKELYEE